MTTSNSLPWTRATTLTLLACALPICCALAQNPEHAQGGTAAAKGLQRLERRHHHEYQQRAFPLGYVPPGARQRALNQIQQATSLTLNSAGFGGGFHWSNLGPAPIQNSSTGGDAVGRVSAVAVDPWGVSHWLLGAAQGGIWETTDAGNNWLPRTDDAPSLAVGAITFAPGNTQIVYAGTGEADFSGDSYAGMGMLKSLDGGTSWFLVAGVPFAETAFSAIKVHSSNPDYLVAATARGVLGVVESSTNLPPTAPARGIFVSHNGGTNWTQTLNGEATDVEVDPYDFDLQYAALGEVLGAANNGVYRSTDGGMSWHPITGPWNVYASTNIGRIEMAIAPDMTNRLYVSIAGNRVFGVPTPLLGIWRTDNAWDAVPVWTQISSPGSPDPGSFPWYSHDLLVHPANPDVVYFAGIDVWRWDGSTGTWQDMPNQHADQHAMAFIPTFDSFRILVGHDGGISSHYDTFGGWSLHLGSIDRLAITQFYKGAVHPGDSSLILGASQDNGTEVYNADPAWQGVEGGDGYSCAISSSKPATDWAVSHQNYYGNTIFRTTDGGKNRNSASWGIDSSTVSFFIGFVKHPTRDDVFIAGALNLWRCVNFFSDPTPLWTSNSPTLFGVSGRPVEITAMAFAPSDTFGRTYAYGTEDGQLSLTTTAGQSWININSGLAVPRRYVTGLAFSPTNAQELYVTLSGFDEGTPGHPGHVFKTTNALNAALTWSDVSPPVNLPADCIAINPVDPQSVFVGSDIGVWSSANGGQNWVFHGPSIGLPHVAVYDLQFDTVGHLTAFTHGRGAFAYRQLPIIFPPLCQIGPCWPGWINPEDLVTVELPLHNVLPDPTINLTVQLLPTAQIMPLNSSQVQTYGVLSVNSPVVTRSFQFQGMVLGAVGGPLVGSSGCGGTVVASFDLQDNGQSLGTINIPFRLGRLTQPLQQDFENAIVPAMPHGWFTRASSAAPWITTSNTPPNVLVPPEPDQVNDKPPSTTGPVSISAFVPDPPSISDSALYSPVIPITTDQAQLSFRHSFDFQPNFDGAVLEIEVGTQPFMDILAAGGSFAANGYNATIVAGTGNPLAGRAAWSADSGGWIITQVNLPPSASMQNVQFRWRLGSDASVGRNGWYIDDVSVTEYPCAPPVTNPIMLRPGFYERVFGFYIATVSMRTYYIEYKNVLDASPWQPLQMLQGDGTTQLVLDPGAGAGQRFYRFRVE